MLFTRLFIAVSLLCSCPAQNPFDGPNNFDPQQPVSLGFQIPQQQLVPYQPASNNGPSGDFQQIPQEQPVPYQSTSNDGPGGAFQQIPQQQLIPYQPASNNDPGGDFQQISQQQPVPYQPTSNNGFQQTQEQQQCSPGQEKKRRSFIYVCRNGNWEPGFCVVSLPNGQGEKRISIDNIYDAGDFIFECSQPSLGRVSLKVIACSIDGQRLDVGSIVAKGRWAFKCLDSPVRKEIVGCVGDDGQTIYNMGVVITGGKPYKCIAGNGIYDMKSLQ